MLPNLVSYAGLHVWGLRGRPAQGLWIPGDVISVPLSVLCFLGDVGLLLQVVCNFLWLLLLCLFASLESSHLLLSLICWPRPRPFVFYYLHWWLWSLTVYLSCPSFMVVCKIPLVNLNFCLGWEPLLGSIFLSALGCHYLLLITLFANNSHICVYGHDLSPELQNHI